MSRDYSVVIRCYNEEEHIGRLLSGICAQTHKPKEILIVDSGSSDATVSIASRFPTKIIDIKKEEFSFGRSLNIGCRQASCDFIIIASGHVYPVFNNWAELLLDPFKNDHVGLVYGKQRGNEHSRYSEQRLLQQWFPNSSQNDQKHPFCNNANAAIRRKLWEDVPYDEDITGLEDLDWARKITQRGFNIVYQAPAEIIHVHNEEYAQIFNRYYREALALNRIYPEEKFGRREFIKLLCSNIFNDLTCAAKEKKLMKNFYDIMMFRWMQFTGTYKGFNNGNVKISTLKNRFYYPAGKDVVGASDENLKDEKINYSAMKNDKEEKKWTVSQ